MQEIVVMSHANGQTLANLVLVIINAPPWAEDIQNTLIETGYKVYVSTVLDDVEQFVAKFQADVLLILVSHEHLDILKTFHIAGINSSDGPLKAIITGSFPTDTPLSEYGVDLVLAPTPSNIHIQLQSMLRIWDQNQEQQRTIAYLQDEMQKHKRTSDEIEIIKNAIVRNVSHELKTPLLQVKSAVSLLAEDGHNAKLIEYATNATTRLEVLVRNITMLGGSLDTHLSPVIVHDAVEHARRNLLRSWQRKDEADRIQVSLQNNLPPVMADRRGLSIVLQLLVDNALKFSKDTVEVKAAQQDNKVLLSVRDWGIGIAQDQLKVIFEMFYQIDPSSTRRYGGTGVGLAIVQLILDHHHSQIDVDSEVGKGSTFSFTLPVVKL